MAKQFVISASSCIIKTRSANFIYIRDQDRINDGKQKQVETQTDYILSLGLIIGTKVPA